MQKIKWSDELVEKEVTEVSSRLGYFPSVGVLKDMGMGALSNAIGSRGGHLFWSSKLGIPRKVSDSDIGWKGEDNVLRYLISLGYEAVKSPLRKSSFDILVDGTVRLDVKSASWAEYGICKGWFYRLDKTPQADLIILHQLDTNSNYVMPWNKCPTTNITISRTGGKYAEYLNSWGILQKYVENLKFIKSE